VYRYRRRRRLNKARFAMFILLVALITAAIIFIAKGGFSGNGDKLTAENSPAPPGTINQPVGNEPTPTPEPTPWPTPDPMPEESTDPAVLDVSWQTPAVFDGPNAYPEYAFEAFGQRIKYWVFRLNTPLAEYKPDYEIYFGSPDQYSSLEGITAFRGNHYRDTAAWGTRDVKEKKLEIVWTHDLGAITAEGSSGPEQAGLASH